LHPLALDDLGARFAQIADRRGPVWDTLWARRNIGRFAVAVKPGNEASTEARNACAGLALADAGPRPARWTPQWQEYLRQDLGTVWAQMQMPGDGFMGLSIARAFHGQSQGLADLFGARVEEQPDGNYYVHPLPPNPATIAALRPKPLEQSLYWAAVEYARYARQASAGLLPIRAPVMTGPLDTANYLLGSTVLLEWVYTEPAALKELLATLTDTIVRFQLALREAAGGPLDPQLAWCLRGGPDICSELRAIISADLYEEFEAPFLREIGRRTGPLVVHSCGDWARTVPSALADPAIRAMNGGSREVDVGELCRLANGRMTLSVYGSQNCHEECLWPDEASFLTHLLKTVPRTQPFEATLSEDSLALWNRLCREHGRPESQVQPAVQEHPDGHV
jgi:hypothetical protein